MSQRCGSSAVTMYQQVLMLRSYSCIVRNPQYRATTKSPRTRHKKCIYSGSRKQEHFEYALDLAPIYDPNFRVYVMFCEAIFLFCRHHFR